MKTRNQLFAMAIVAIITISIIGCSDGGGNSSPPPEQPQKKPDTTRALSFGTDCKVTIKSDDLFLTTEWTTLCNKAVAAVERGYNAAGAAGKEGLEEYLNENTLSVVLLKTATYDLEVKSDEVGIIYMKANASTIDGLTETDLRGAVSAVTNSISSQRVP
jgi:hypothetical protein